MLRQVGDLFELNLKLRCQKVSAGVPVCVFLPNQLSGYCSICFTDVDMNVVSVCQMSVCQMSVEDISAPYHLILYSRCNNIREARFCIMGKTLSAVTFGPKVTFAIDMDKYATFVRIKTAWKCP